MTASKDEYPNIIHETFISRVSNFSIVNHSLMTLHQAYSRTKNSNRVIKYSIESVESKVLGFAQPIISTISPALQPLDRFANSALDRVLELASDSNEFVGSGMVNTHVLIQQSIAAIESQLRLISEIVMSRRDELSQHSVQVADVISQAQSTIVSSLKAVIGGLMSLSYLPDAAKHNIRLFILAFPQRLKNRRLLFPENPVEKVLALGRESLHMLRNIDKTIDNARKIYMGSVQKID